MVFEAQSGIARIVTEYIHTESNMSTHSIQITEPATFEREDCPNCGVIHFVPTALQKQAKMTGRNFYCPNGHPAVYNGGENERLRKQAEKLAADLASEKKRKEWAEQAAKNQMERADQAIAENARLKRRVHNGVCPCCKRTFQNLARHMKTKHPSASG